MICICSVDQRVRHRRDAEQRGQGDGQIGKGSRPERLPFLYLVLDVEGADPDPRSHFGLQFDECTCAEPCQLALPETHRESHRGEPQPGQTTATAHSFALNAET